MKRRIMLTFIVLVAIFNYGCSTLNDVKAAKGTGKIKVYEKPYAEVWDTVLEIVKTSGLNLISENKDEGIILAKGPVTVVSYGENVAIFIEYTSLITETRVEVVSKGVFASFPRDWAPIIFEALTRQ